MRFFLALSFLATTLSATTFFDPPNPTSATPVIAHVTIPPSFCPPVDADVVRNGSTISITLIFPACPLTPPGIVPFDFAVNLGVLPAGIYDVVANGGLDRGKLVVRDAAPPFEVIPNVIPTTGGQVRLHARPIYVCTAGVSPPICPTHTVTVDGVPATIVSDDGIDIVVNVPSHAPGVVDVAVQFTGFAKTATAALDFFEFDKTPEPAFFEPVVFPALVTGPGAFGSQWSTDVSMRNGNDEPLPVTSTFLNVACFPVCDACPPAHSTVTVRGGNAPAGIVFYAARQFAPRLFFDELARDLSRQSEALGTEIPVARENDLYDRPFSIMLVPAEAKYRTSLRVVRTDGIAGVNFRIFSMNADGPTNLPIVSGQLPLSIANANTPMFTSTNIPDLVQRFPELAGKGPLRIEIDTNASRAVWALVSVTNNETQHVTVIAPH